MKLLFFILFSFFAHTDDKCLKTFDTLNENPHQEDSLKLTGLIEGLREQLDQTQLLSQREKKAFLKEIEFALDYLKTENPGPNHKARLEVLEPSIRKAFEVFPSIVSFLEAKPPVHLDKKQVLKVIVMTLTKYVRVYLSHPDDTLNIDFARFTKTLSSIAEFNDNAFSLYRVIRSVREKYSLHEYLNCK